MRVSADVNMHEVCYERESVIEERCPDRRARTHTHTHTHNVAQTQIWAFKHIWCGMDIHT